MKPQLKAALHATVVFVGLSVIYWRFRGQPWTWSRLVGLALAVPGFLLWMTARFQLGKSFAVRAKAQELVTRGLYSRIRNPIYVFGYVCLAGLLLWIGRPQWLLIFVVLVPLQVLRARKEARVLEEKFGEAYRQYRRQTWF